MTKPTVAIIGTSGFLGKPTLDAFESSIFADKFQFPIKALSRSSKPSTDKIEYIQGSLDDEGIDKVVESFKGVDVIIELSGPKVYGPVETLVKQVKPKLFIPSQFGTEIDKSDKVFPGFLDIKTKHSKAVRDVGIKTVDVITSLFASPGAFLYEIVGQVGIDSESKTVTYRGDPNIKFSFTHVNDIGRSVVAIAAIDPSKLPDKIRIQSGLITPSQVVERYEKDHNVKLAVKNESAEEALKAGKAKYAQGFNPADFLFYLSVILSQGVDHGLRYSQNENELVNPGNASWNWDQY
ncbi:unnamed protein product [Debaryomyces tyrocola]|nr:unnamed protein product [Debaryomyces tyrocola]